MLEAIAHSFVVTSESALPDVVRLSFDSVAFVSLCFSRTTQKYLSVLLNSVRAEVATKA